MAQLELANLLAANGAPAAPASSGAGIEGNSQASAPAISFSQWFQSNPPATPGAAALAETMAGDGARAAANPPTTPAEGIAAPPVDAGRAETLALVIGALDGTALTPSADGSGDLEEPVGESDAGESPERARDGATAELPWLGLPLVMDARAALRAQDGASADPAPETETINGAVAGFERLRSMPWPGSSSWSASGGGAGLGANGGVASEVATAVSRPETVAALAPGNAGGLPSTGLDAALQPLTDAGAIESPALKSMPSPGLQPAIISSSMPESVAANPPRLDLTLPSPASSEAPVEGEGAARDARVFSLGVPGLDRMVVADVNVKPQPASAPSTAPIVASVASVRASAHEPALADLAKGPAARPAERDEPPMVAAATIAAATRIEEQAKVGDRWPAARWLVNQSLRRALEQADSTAPAELKHPSSAENLTVATPAPAAATPVAMPPAPRAIPVDAGLPPLATVWPEAGASGQASSPEAAGDDTAIPPAAVASVKNFSVAERAPALSGGPSAAIAVPAPGEVSPNPAGNRTGELVAPNAGGTLPLARPPAAEPARADPSTASFLPVAPEVLNVHQKHWERTLGQQLRWMVDNQLQEAKIKVNPPELGPLEVRVSLHHQQTNVTFFSHEAAVREALETTLPRLRELLDAQGINLNQTQVADPSLARQQAGTGQQPAYGQRDGRDRPPALPGAEPAAEPAESRPRARGWNGVVDDYA